MEKKIKANNCRYNLTILENVTYKIYLHSHLIFYKYISIRIAVNTTDARLIPHHTFMPRKEFNLICRRWWLINRNHNTEIKYLLAYVTALHKTLDYTVNKYNKYNKYKKYNKYNKYNRYVLYLLYCQNDNYNIMWCKL